MEDARGPRRTGCPDSIDEAREGGKLDMCECFGSAVAYVATAWCTMICFELCCLIVGEIFPVYPAERCVLNGKVTLVLIVCPLL